MIQFDEKNFIAELDRQAERLFLQKVEHYENSIAATMRAHGYVRVNASERTVLFTFGEMTYSRSRWERDGQVVYPVDKWLGLDRYTRLSPELIYHLVKHASVMSYRQVCKVIESSYRLHVTKDSVLKAVKIAGKLFSENERYRFYRSEEAKKIKAKRIYPEGDGVMVKTTDAKEQRYNTDLAHFVIHTGSKRISKNRYKLENKHEIIHVDYDQAKEEVLDYIYNHFEITKDTVLITNSDNGKGYTKHIFTEIKKALGIKHHEHFWDAYHVNETLTNFFKPYPRHLRDLAFKAVQTHQRDLMYMVLDTVESLISTDEEYERFENFSRKIRARFSDTKPPKLRGLSAHGIGIMESQHRKVTYRMKHRGMYWSLTGACTMAKVILLERVDQLEELFFGEWRDEYEMYIIEKRQRLKINKVYPRETFERYNLLIFGGKFGRGQNRNK